MTNSLLTFPCQFPIKIIARNEDNLVELIKSIITPIYGQIDNNSITEKPSKNDNYKAITVTIKADSQNKIDRIYQALTDHPSILMCL